MPVPQDAVPELQMPVPQEIDLAVPEVTLPKGLCYESDNFKQEFSIGYLADANVQKLTPEQSVIYNDFTQKIQNGRSGLCFLDAPGGCGKTFLIETILASQRAKGSIAIATASTGLAATLLPGGRTVHSTFKVPLNIINAETPSCSIKKVLLFREYFKTRPY